MNSLLRLPPSPHNGFGLFAAAALLALVATVVTGCQAPPSVPPVAQAALHDEPTALIEGDVLRLTFPGAPNLDVTQPIRRDGRIALPLVGEVRAAGLTPLELEKELARMYSSELVSGEVGVTVVSSSFPVFVTGAVLRPGKIISERSLTALEAVMEAGGFIGAKANSREVVVVRQEGGQTKKYTVNLKAVLEGRDSEPFYLKPSDIVYVPERFTWF